LSHLWQRFLLASSLLVGIALGVGATIFGFDNTSRVDVYWIVFHMHGVPVWAVAVLPVALVLVAGTVFHWLNGLHHFTEHMRHRRRVHELEAELATLRAHLDQVLEMPAVSSNKPAAPKESPVSPPATNGELDEVIATEPEPPVAETEPEVAAPLVSRKSRKRVKLELGDEPRSNAEEEAGDGTPTETDVPKQEA
jgi:hypothetical protein